MSEANYWTKVRPMLFGWDPVRIENRAALGTPDVNHIHGWIELKWMPKWPVRADTPVTIDHFTAQQKTWLRRRCVSGGKAHVLLGIGGDNLLIWGEDAADYLGKVPKAELLDVASHVWLRGAKMKKELKNAILENRPVRGRGLFDPR